MIECNEIEKSFAATLTKNSNKGGHLEGANIVCKDIVDYQPSAKKIDFIIGGPPCQTFSAAGARAAGVNGTDDDRGNLFLQYARIIDLLQPKGFLFENVYRIVGAQSGKPWKQILAAFRELGYQLFWRILDAADYGVPQFRERLIIVGLKSGTFRFPFPSHGPDSSDRREYYTAQHAVADLNVTQNTSSLGGRHGHLLRDIPPGLNYSFYTDRMGHPNPLFAWRSKFSDYLYKADPKTPVRTIKAQGGQYTGPFSWKNRPFTTEELKRLQTFPDDYLIEGNRQTVIHQLGNSVPPQLARILALSILEQVFHRKMPFSIPLMPETFFLGFRSRKTQLTEVYARKSADAIANLSKIQPTSALPPETAEYFFVSSDMSIQTGLSKTKSTFRANYNLSETQWLVSLYESVRPKKSPSYQIQITPPKSERLHVENTLSQLVSFSSLEYSILAAWKFYEKLIQRHQSKDDLVQLFGYYQYKQKYFMKMTILDKALQRQPFWRVIGLVTSGIGVGEIVESEELRDLFNVTKEQLTVSLNKLKAVGYEIRSHNTNKQIKPGMILIPYAFPTLNERSLQRLTRL